MICPYIINISVLIGGILSWGLMWPLIKNKEGHWYDKGLGESNLHGIQGYRVSFLFKAASRTTIFYILSKVYQLIGFILHLEFRYL